MSDAVRRIPEKAGFVNRKLLPRGPRGFALCRACGAECPGANRTFCSDECVHDWKMKTQPSYQARHVLERDKGVCEACGADTLANKFNMQNVARVAMGSRDPAKYKEAVELAIRYGFVPKKDQARMTAYPTWSDVHEIATTKRRPWDMDHRVPVVEGGGSCGIDNLRTLCRPCHADVTAELHRRRAAARRAGACANKETK